MDLAGSATPKSAKSLTFKMANAPAATVCTDPEENHGRKVSVHSVQAVTDLIGAISLELSPPPDTAALPKPEDVAVIAVGVDGEEKFWFVMGRHLAAVKAHYPDSRYDGISDGARDYVPWQTKNTDQLTLDFYHAAGYLGAGSGDMVEAGKGKGARQKQWLSKACTQLKHEDGAAAALLKAMEKRRRRPELGAAAQARLDKSISYFSNNLSRMDSAQLLRENHPIASGVTEAACGLIIKDRMCSRGMRWSLLTAQHLITLRSLIKSTGNGWQNFWKLSFNRPVN